MTHLLLAKSQYRNGKLKAAKKTCKSFLKIYEDSPYQFHCEMLLADIYLSEGFFTDAFEAYLSLRKSLKDTVNVNLTDSRIISCISNKINPIELEGMLFTEENKINKIIINLGRAYISWIDGNKRDLSLALNGIDNRIVPSTFLGLYESLVTASERKLKNQTTVALVLSISGLDSRKGISYITGLSDYLYDNQNKSFVRFELFDTKSDDIEAFKILKTISARKEICAILGPLNDNQILIAAGLVSSIPILVPKSDLIGLSEESSNLYFLSPSGKTLAKRTVQLLVEEMGLNRFGILSPGDGLSFKTSKYFIEGLNYKGIDPVIVEWYYNKPVDLSRHFKSIRSKAWDLKSNKNVDGNITGMEIDSLEGLFDVDVDDFFNLSDEESKIQMSKKDSAKIVLETIDALFIPISKNELKYIGTQLPMYNLSTQVIGNENWLDMDILNQNLIGPHVQGMRIVTDVSFPAYIKNKNDFDNYYLLAYDHHGFINLLANNSNGNRRSFLRQLNKLVSYRGESVSIQFGGKNNNENQSTQVLEYKNNKMNSIGIYNGDSLEILMP